MSGDQQEDRRWQVESWRLTSFLTAEDSTSQPVGWSDIVGHDPELRGSNSRLGSLEESGPFERGRLVMTVLPGRVDWTLDAQPSSDAIRFDYPTLGAISASIDSFRTIAERWLGSSPSILRIAVGAVLLQPSSDKPEAYQRIVEYVPGLRLDTPDCSDFLYRINRPRASAIDPTMRINRLTNWSALTSQLVRLGSADSAPIPARSPFIAVRLDLDMNTPAERTAAIECAALSLHFDELVSMLLELSEHGDIP